jgi:hypothetical protein
MPATGDWTDGQITVLRSAIAAKLPRKDIAEHTGRSWQACETRARKLGVVYT